MRNPVFFQIPLIELTPWARIFRPPVEGKIVNGAEGLEVGDKVRVKLVATNVEMGFIDFVRA